MSGPRMETLLVFAAWHPERGYDVRNISELHEDVVFRLGSKATNEGWEPALVYLTLEPATDVSADELIRQERSDNGPFGVGA